MRKELTWLQRNDLDKLIDEERFDELIDFIEEILNEQ